MAAWLGGATSVCLCLPLGPSAWTNKPTPGLRSNGNQTCSRTKSPLAPSLLFFFPPALCMTNPPLTHTPAEGRTSIIPNRPENIPLSFTRVFPHGNSSWRSVFLHQRWPSWPSGNQTPVTCAYLRALTCFLYQSPFFPQSIYHIHTNKALMLIPATSCPFPVKSIPTSILLPNCESHWENGMLSKCIIRCSPHDKDVEFRSPWLSAGCWVRGAHLWQQSLNVLIVRVQSLSVNVLPVSLLSLSECSVSLKYEYWHAVRPGAEKALKTHRASTLTPQMKQRGLIVMWPADSVPHRHVVVFKLHNFITAFFFLNDKSGIKIHVNTSFSCYFSLARKYNSQGQKSTFVFCVLKTP